MTSSPPIATRFKKAGHMKRHNALLVFLFVLSPARAVTPAAAANAPPSYEEARRASWTMTSALVEKILPEGDAQ